jgi:hypothetical protein
MPGVYWRFGVFVKMGKWKSEMGKQRSFQKPDISVFKEPATLTLLYLMLASINEKAEDVKL